MSHVSARIERGYALTGDAHPATGDWLPVGDRFPDEPVLLWVDGRPMIGILVEGNSEGTPWRSFMDPHTDELLPWPSYWMRIARP